MYTQARATQVMTNCDSNLWFTQSGYGISCLLSMLSMSLNRWQITKVSSNIFSLLVRASHNDQMRSCAFCAIIQTSFEVGMKGNFPPTQHKKRHNDKRSWHAETLSILIRSAALKGGFYLTIPHRLMIVFRSVPYSPWRRRVFPPTRSQFLFRCFPLWSALLAPGSFRQRFARTLHHFADDNRLITTETNGLEPFFHKCRLLLEDVGSGSRCAV